MELLEGIKMNDENENYNVIECSMEKEMMRLTMLHEFHERFSIY